MTPLAAGLRPGAACLAVECVNGLSTVTSARSQQPARLLLPVSRGPTVWACTSNFGGGMVAGDHTHLEIRLGAGTRCYLGSQASSKIYRTPPSKGCSHTTTANVGPGAVLVFAPDPVQPFAHASFSQSQQFDLAPDANLVLVDWINAGRIARGERWAFRHYQSRNEIFLGAERIFLDALVLNPDEGRLTEPLRLDRFNGLATLILHGPAVLPHAQAMVEEISQRPVTRNPPLLVAASPSRNGAVVRIAGVQPETIGRELRHHLRFLHDMLQEAPWDRKN